MAKIIGITGLIASGKSTLTDYLLKKDFKVFDADLEVKKLYSNKVFLNNLKKIFPNVFIDNKLDKSLLTNLIFSNINKKKQLENFIHPLVEKKCDKFIENNINQKLIFIDIPLLFEVNWDKKCNKIILIIINQNIQKERYIKRGGKEEIFKKILKNQEDISTKINKSNYIIENNSNIQNFYDKIDNTLLKLLY